MIFFDGFFALFIDFYHSFLFDVEDISKSVKDDNQLKIETSS